MQHEMKLMCWFSKGICFGLTWPSRLQAVLEELPIL